MRAFIVDGYGKNDSDTGVRIILAKLIRGSFTLISGFAYAIYKFSAAMISPSETTAVSSTILNSIKSSAEFTKHLLK